MDTTAACYRHPERETGLRCSSCGRAICPECMTHAAVGLRCPDCAGRARAGGFRPRPRAQVLRPRAITTTAPVVTYALIAANLVMFALTTNLNQLSSGFGLGGAGPINALGYRLALFGPAVSSGEYYRLITGAFVHDGLLHIGFNMWALWILGSVFESTVGSGRMAAVYFVSLLAGSFGALWLSPLSPTVGASGAIFGLMGALFVFERQRGLGVMRGGIGGWIVINLLFTFYAHNAISIGGHIGGLIGGGLAGFALSGYGRGHMAYGRLGAASLLGLAAIGVVSVVGALQVA